MPGALNFIVLCYISVEMNSEKILGTGSGQFIIIKQ